MVKIRKIPLGIMVAGGFALTIVLVLLTTYFVSKMPSAEERCKKECAAKGKFGKLTHKYPTYIPQGKVPLVCECST
jgi:hypothetical protein